MAEWQRIVNTTITQHIREIEPAVLRNRKLTAALQSRGRISFNNSGKNFDWRMEYKRKTLSQWGDMDVLGYIRTNRWQVPELDWRGYIITEVFSGREMELNKGKEAIVKLVSDLMSGIETDMKEGFGDEMYVDGNLAGNEQRIHGIESFMGGSYTTGKCYTPSDTYAGLSTALAGLGGSWTGTGPSAWPLGSGTAEYDVWSPVMINFQSDSGANGFSQATGSWALNAVEALRFGIQIGSRNAGKTGRIDMVMLDQGLYLDFLQALTAKEHIMITTTGGLLRTLGFEDVQTLDGVDVTSEFGIPQNALTENRVGYGWNLDKMELKCVYPTLFQAKGPFYDENQDAHRLMVKFLGNLRFFSPRYFVKWLGDT